MRRFQVARLWSGAMLALFLVFAELVSTTSAGAQTSTLNDIPARALPLLGVATGEIGGAGPLGGDGGFAFYSFIYPGDNKAVTFEVNFAPGDTVTADRDGFNIYGPTMGILYAKSAITGTTPSHRAILQSSEPGIYLLQLYNYSQVRVAYEARVKNLPPQPGAPAEGAATATLPTEPLQVTPTITPVRALDNRSPQRAIELVDAVEGTLAGDTGGSYHYYAFGYKGDNSFVRLTLTVDPPDVIAARSTGFVVYGPIAGREYAKAGFELRLTPQIKSFQAEEQGSYIVQVANFLAIPINYRLELKRNTQ